MTSATAAPAASATSPARSTTAAVRTHRRKTPWVGLAAWVLGVFFVAPAVWMVWLSFHSESDAAANPPKFTAPLTVEGYRDFFGSGSASPWPALFNSLAASVVSTLIVLLLAFPRPTLCRSVR